MQNELKLLPVSILLPVFNEHDVIKDVIEEWNSKVLKKIKGSELIVDDCSTDNTGLIIKKLKKKIPNIRYSFTKKDSFHNAIVRMAKKARNNLLFMTDSDGQYPVNSFWKLYRYVDDHDIVTGYKLKREDVLYRKFLSYIFNIIISFIFFFKFKNYDYNCFYRFIDKKIFLFLEKKIKFLRLRFPSTELFLLAIKYKLKIKRISIKTFYRKYGNSNALPLSLIFKIIFPTILAIILLRINFFFQNHKKIKILQ
jgi:glycosyltransferase involved in cell wall biosynthesis